MRTAYQSFAIISLAVAPLALVAPPSRAVEPSRPAPAAIAWQSDYDAGMARAYKTRTPILCLVSGEFCPICLRQTPTSRPHA